MNLAQTQSVFTAGLEPAGSAAQRARAAGLIHENSRIPAELAVTIYANNVSAALLKALTAAFPACRRILGETCFNAIAYRFIEHEPSTQADLNRYGASFSDFLEDWTATWAPFSNYRYLGDLARLEWHCHKAYTADDDPPFDFKTLAEAGHIETLRFQLGHSVGLLQSEYPVMEIRETNLCDDDASEVRADKLPEYLLVSRSALQLQVERIDASTFQLLAAFRDGRTLVHMSRSGGRLKNTLPESLAKLIRRRWITGFSTDSVCTSGDSVDV